jgi:hypothetical protein
MLRCVADVDASGSWSVHRTLAAATVDRLTFGGNFGQVEVLNRSGAAEIYFTVDGADPTVGGSSTHVLPATISALVVRSGGRANTTVKLISSGTPTYSVRSA